MRTAPLRYYLTLLLASGGCLTGSSLLRGLPALAQTLPPQGVPNVTGSATADGPVTASGTNSPTLPASPATPATSPATPSSSAAASSAATSSTAAATQGGATSPTSPAPNGAPSGTTAAATSPPAVSAGTTANTPGATATSATTAAPAPGGAAAAAAAQSDDNTVYLENADLLRLTSDDSAVLTGNVKVRYQDYTIYADKAVVNSDTGRVEFSGHIKILSSSTITTITGTDPNTHLQLDSRNNSYSVVGANHAVIDPNLLQGSELLLPLRVDSNDAYSVNNILDVRQGGFTTCDFLHPHYYIGTRSLTVIPGRRLVARHAVLYRRGRRLFEIPYLIVPLNNRYNLVDYLPLVGEDSEEGYYAKFAIPYALAGAATGILRLDFMSNIGTGTGFDQSYDSHGPNAGGTLSLYHLDDRESGLQDFTGSIVHNQNIGNFSVGLNSQFESNSYGSSSGASQNFSGALNVSGSEGKNLTTFTSNLTQSDYGEGVDSSLSASLNQLMHIGGLNTFGIKLNYSGANDSTSITQAATGVPSSPTQPTSPTTSTAIAALAASAGTTTTTTTTLLSTIASNLDLHLQPGGLIVNLQTDLFKTLQNSSNAATGGTSINGFAGLERNPELMLQTTGTGSDPLDEIARLVRGSQIQVGLGDYIETASDSHTSRAYFSYDGGAQVRHTGDFTLTSDSSFQQAFYGDGGAQYLLNGRYGSTYTHGPLTLSANYGTLRGYGYTPFLFDHPGNYNNASFAAGYSPNKAVTYSAATAYNFLQDRGMTFGSLRIPADPWQNLIAIVNVHPTILLNDQFQSTYDPNTHKLFDVTNNFYAANRTGFGLTTAADYLPQENKFGLVTGALDLPIILDQREQAGYKIQAIAGYDGMTSKFTYQGIALTRSWHDFEVTATYQNDPYSFGAESNTFSFTLHLKAFPGYQPFGVAATGQQLAGGIGQVY